MSLRGKAEAISYQNFLDVAVEASLLSGEIQKEGLKTERQIDFKGTINIVTDIDHACEEAIVKIIQGRFPDHDVLAEEGRGYRTDSEFKWIIDPLDGTTNYAHGYPLFATSIALEHRGEIVVGAVLEPNLNELFTAVKNKGAYLNGKKISVSKTTNLNHALLCTGFAYNIREVKHNNVEEFQKFLFQSRAVRRDGVAATDLCYVACGRYDGFWELELYPWDVGAGYLMVKEAGGVVTNYQGNEFSIYDKEIVASNGLLHASMLEVLK